ncbi:hypothetical protein OG21DRAFT_1525176 [Imleria badia]|nr:hypothetical protein OG21DRAFT_1525176 [Imleria badia]
MPLPHLASILSLNPHGSSENQGVDAERDPDWLLVPALEELELYQIQFAPALPPDMDSDVLATYAQSLYDALSSRKESQGQLAMVQCFTRYNDYQVELNMVGKWEGGHFRVVEEHCRRWSGGWWSNCNHR